MILKNEPDKPVTKRNSFIRLSLRKPKEWKVALTTSVSSPAIIPPEIQLWDEEQGNVLLDTSLNCVRSKSASFTRKRGSSSENHKLTSKNMGSVESHSSRKQTNNGKDFPSNCFINRSDGRSKSLSTRNRKETLVKPEEYERPPTPVMVARKISLPKDSYATSAAKSEKVNGIVTHHRKQISDSSSTGSRRKVKHSVSFGRVDTFDDSSSISSSFSLSKTQGIPIKNVQSVSSSSSPRIVITEVTDTGEDYVPIPEKSRNGKVKHRSRSGIPIMVGNREISTNTEPRSSNQTTQRDNRCNNENGKSGRKSRMELFMSQKIGKHKFTVTRVPEKAIQSLSERSSVQQTPSRHHCDRGNCPFEKYSDNSTTRVKDPSRNNILGKPNGTVKSFPGNLVSKNDVFDKDKQKRNGSKKRECSRQRKNRVPSRSRQEAMSSSSSDSEGWKTPRTPPRRKRWSRTPKGDRLVGVNGSWVRTPREAEEKLRHSPDIVHLHLQRRQDGITRSLPRHRLEEDEDMGSNMSRHSGKGLTGRRSQSSGNLCNGKAPSAPGVARFFSPCGRGNDTVGSRDRYKFCGSLPNHLDSNDEVPETDEYRNNNNVNVRKKNSDVVLRLQPLVPKGIGGLGAADSVPMDQGYGSERSPEDEVPPDLPPPTTVSQLTCPVHHPGPKPVYPFLHKNSTFTVTLLKGTRGLGLSVTGGVDTEEPWPGLIRIKRLFPHQPAWQSGQLAPGDFLLVVNNTSLVGLTNYEALEVLRTTPAEVVLTVCRPPPELQVLSAPPPADTAPAPPPPRRDNTPSTSTSSLQLPLKRMESFGEFELTLKKVNGSLGFTLRKEDESILGHYVRALVREPALSDGRIKPGDKIVAVNGVDMSPMSHEEAVMFLRQCGQEVHLRLYRDPAQTPVQALSPTEHHRTIKPILRKEAQDMLSDLAVKKSMSPNESSGSSTLSKEGRTSSPRKRRLTKTPSPDLGSERLENHLSWSDEVLERISPGGGGEKPKRPDTLNFSAERKPHFQFSAVSKTEENLASLDSLDCSSIGNLGVGPLPSEPVSMPPLITSTSDSTVGFSYRNPAYRSANPAPTKSKSSLSEDLPENRCSDNDLTAGAAGDDGGDGSKGLLKWKGVVFTPDDGAETTTATSPDDSISQITEVDSIDNQVLVVELNRGWNSRLGFSLQQSGRNTLISAIHPDSVASRDGRLKVGDQLVMVNDESIEGMSTTEVIDLLRKIRGSICITVWRKSS